MQCCYFRDPGPVRDQGAEGGVAAYVENIIFDAVSSLIYVTNVTPANQTTSSTNAAVRKIKVTYVTNYRRDYMSLLSFYYHPLSLILDMYRFVQTCVEMYHRTCRQQTLKVYICKQILVGWGKPLLYIHIIIISMQDLYKIELILLFYKLTYLQCINGAFTMH